MKPGNFYNLDPWLEPFKATIENRLQKCHLKEMHLSGTGSLADFSMGHFYYGLHRSEEGWIFREWAPNAEAIYLTGGFNGWKEVSSFALKRINSYGDWEIKLPGEMLHHGDLYKLSMHWKGGSGERIPSYATRLVQDERTKIFSAQVWHPDEPYNWIVRDFEPSRSAPVIYEAHIGMATSEDRLGTYSEFAEKVLPEIIRSG